jgi:hypothetical protein
VTAVQDDLTQALLGEGQPEYTLEDESVDFGDIHAANQVLIQKAGGLVSEIRGLGAELRTPAGVARFYARLSLEDQAAFFIQDEILASRATLAGLLVLLPRRLSTAERVAFMDALEDAGSLNGT